MKLSKQIGEYLNKRPVNPDEAANVILMESLKQKLVKCASLSLYANSTINNQSTYIASHTCDSKTCFICNYNRQKRVRRKYMNWFKENEFIFKLSNGKYCTAIQLNKKLDKGLKATAKLRYDLMHLTLTVPHTANNGFNGVKYYFQEIAQLYWLMRKTDFWQKEVFGGEYGIETTINESGNHIHIHSLLMVRKFDANRNYLHKQILLWWNKNTISKHSRRTSFSDEAIRKIKKGNKSLTDSDINLLNPKGATMIGLNNIYNKTNQGKQYANGGEWANDAMMKAVKETIKYHFEPAAFDKKDKTFKLDELFELLPVIYKKQLYRKFGVLHGEKSLNVKATEENLVEDLKDIVDNEELMEAMDKETGEIIREYLITNPSFIFHDPEKDNAIIIGKSAKEHSRRLEAFSTFEALAQMGKIIKDDFKHN